MILIRADEIKVDIDSLNEDEYNELLRLKNEINERIDYFNNHASDRAIEKTAKYKERLADTPTVSRIKENNFKINDENSKKTIKHLNFINKVLFYINNFITAVQKNVDIDPGRIMGLTDGIFGMVMTLLIFGIALPEAELVTSLDFYNFIQSLAPTVGVTLVSFVLLGSFWIYHHEFLNVTSLNIPYLWFNMLFLASVSFVPLTTSIIGNYSQFFLANVLFGLNIFLTVIFFILLFRYADHMNFLEKEVTAEEKKYTYNTFYIIMGLTVAVNLLDFNVSSNFIYLFFLVPVISVIRDTMFKLKQ